VARNDRRATTSIARRVGLGAGGALAAFAMAFSLFMLVEAVGGQFGWKPRPQSVAETIRAARGVELGVLISFTLLVMPFAEEVVYRGLLLPALARNMRPWIANLCQALLFGAAHFMHAPSQWPLLFPLAAVGWCAGWLYHRTGSLVPAVVLHAGYNGLQLAILFGWLG
jgi:membrane protease YdiL (CAAX protease family)